MTQTKMIGFIKSPLIIILICFTNLIYSQDTISTDSKKQFLINSQVKLTLSTPNIIANFRRGYFHEGDEYVASPTFESASNLNVFDYFNLNETYNSDLQKNVFKQTLEYKTLLDSLKSIKLSYLNSIYYEIDFNSVGGQTFDLENHEGGGYIVNYDLQKKGFFIGIGEVLPYHCISAFCPKVINDVEFKQLSITKKYNLYQSKKSYTQYLFIPMDAETALKVENNRNQIQILRLFNIAGLYTPTFNDPDFVADNHGKTCKIKVIKGGNMRLFIYNKVTFEVYYDKIYPATTPK